MNMIYFIVGDCVQNQVSTVFFCSSFLHVTICKVISNYVQNFSYIKTTYVFTIIQSSNLFQKSLNANFNQKISHQKFTYK